MVFGIDTPVKAYTVSHLVGRGPGYGSYFAYSNEVTHPPVDDAVSDAGAVVNDIVGDWSVLFSTV